MTTETQDVETTDVDVVKGRQGADLDKVESALRTGEWAGVEDPDDLRRAIMERILSAETAEDVLAPQTTISTEDLVDVPLEVRDVRWLQSRLDGSLPIFAVIDAVNIETGETITVNSSAAGVMVRLLKLQQLGALPRKVVVRKSKRETEAGYFPIWIERYDP